MQSFSAGLIRLMENVAAIFLIGFIWITFLPENHLASAAILSAAAGGNTQSIPADSKGGGHGMNAVASVSASTSRTSIPSFSAMSRFSDSSPTHFTTTTTVTDNPILSSANTSHSSSSHLSNAIRRTLSVRNLEIWRPPVALIQILNKSREFTRPKIVTPLPWSSITGLVRVQIWRTTTQAATAHTKTPENATAIATTLSGDNNSTLSTNSDAGIHNSSIVDSHPTISFQTVHPASNFSQNVTQPRWFPWFTTSSTKRNINRTETTTISTTADNISTTTSPMTQAESSTLPSIFANLPLFIHQSADKSFLVRSLDGIMENATSSSTTKNSRSTEPVKPTRPAISTTSSSTTTTTVKTVTPSTLSTTLSTAVSGALLYKRTRKFQPHVNKDIYKSPDWFFPYPGRWPPKSVAKESEKGIARMSTTITSKSGEHKRTTRKTETSINSLSSSTLSGTIPSSMASVRGVIDAGIISTGAWSGSPAGSKTLSTASTIVTGTFSRDSGSTMVSIGKLTGSTGTRSTPAPSTRTSDSPSVTGAGSTTTKASTSATSSTLYITTRKKTFSNYF